MDSSTLIIVINIITSLNSVLCSIIFSSFLLYKSNLSRQDIIIAQKFFIQFVFNASFLCISVIKAGSSELSYMHISVFAIYLNCIFIFNFAITYESYHNLKDPSHLFRLLIKKSNSYIYVDLYILLFSGGIILYCCLKGGDNNSSYNIDSMLGLCIYYLIVGILLIFFYFLNKKNYPNYKLKSHSTLLLTNKLYLGINTLYFLYSLILCVFSIIDILDYQGTIAKNIESSVIITLGVYILCSLDCLFYMAIVYNSSFYYYTLSSYPLGSLYFCFGCKKYKNTLPESSNSEDYISIDKDNSYKTNDTNEFMINLFNNIGYIVDDYIIDTFEYFLNISLLSIKEAYINNYPLDIGSNCEKTSTITKVTSATTNLLSEIKTGNKDDKIKKLKLNKNTFDCTLFEKWETNNSAFSFKKVGDLNVDIESHYSSQIQDVLTNYKITKTSIITSLLSHKFISLLSKNAKDKQFFKSMNNFTIKTYDKKLLIEIHNGNILDQKMNNLLDKYFQYLTEKKEKTFIPILVGVFKIKINSFRPVVLFISMNPFIEDVPDGFYNFWQLMKFSSSKKLDKVSSSKDRDTFIITTELLFEKNKKFRISEFDTFKYILKEDIQFLKNVNSNKFSLLILYYELDLDKSNSNGNKNQNNNHSNNFDSLIERDNQEENENDLVLVKEVAENNLIKIENEEDHIPENIENIEEDQNFYDGKTLFFSDSSATICKNGFPCVYGSFKGVVYFSFDNLFSIGGFLTKTKNFYKNYFVDLLEYFEWK